MMKITRPTDLIAVAANPVSTPSPANTPAEADTQVAQPTPQVEVAPPTPSVQPAKPIVDASTEVPLLWLNGWVLRAEGEGLKLERSASRPEGSQRASAVLLKLGELDARIFVSVTRDTSEEERAQAAAAAAATGGAETATDETAAALDNAAPEVT